ncbi:acetolactate decarboxylase [Luteirhabdus pelagi]|uniref:acetolactate decarboxylase n=1 Tax=Luteirhabdus pelagi TaxID=2792783 RepID=UPI001F37AB30|nr:acetolactate decarboxylase [Luteirhabdus pelagi]
MKYILTYGCLIFFLLSACNSKEKEGAEKSSYEVVATAAMKDVMWKGKLGPAIAFDTLQPKKGLYGLGPSSYLRGEIMILDSETYVSKVTSDSTMTVSISEEASAPFFVHSYISDWEEVKIPDTVQTLQQLEKFIDQVSQDNDRPFPFLVKGTVTSATIHVQNLPKGTTVSSPAEAHQGQTNYKLQNKKVTMLGFFSTEHQGIFTHHDSYLHIHLITEDRSKMGHLDEAVFHSISLFLPRDSEK